MAFFNFANNLRDSPFNLSIENSIKRKLVKLPRTLYVSKLNPVSFPTKSLKIFK